jgi:hypothetical protein
VIKPQHRYTRKQKQEEMRVYQAAHMRLKLSIHAELVALPSLALLSGALPSLALQRAPGARADCE